MSKCRRLKSCSFFNTQMKSMPVTAEYIKKYFCEDDHARCARNYLFTYMEKKDFSVDGKIKDMIAKMSDTLYPNQIEKVKKAFAESGVK